jgi:hypothetical protein
LAPFSPADPHRLPNRTIYNAVEEVMFPEGPAGSGPAATAQSGWRRRQESAKIPGLAFGALCAPLSAPSLRKGSPAMIISILITFLVIILILYLVNLLPIDGRAKHILRVVVIVLGIISMLKYLAVF